MPIHPQLIKIGLIKYIECLKTRKDARLFPELKQQRDGFSQAVSEWFGRFRKKLEISQQGLVFHSFRHTFAERLRCDGVVFDVIAGLLGHKIAGQTGRYVKALPIEIAQ